MYRGYCEINYENKYNSLNKQKFPTQNNMYMSLPQHSLDK